MRSRALTAAGAFAGVRSEITVTPLVDVCLVLLIIFMVVAPLLGGGVEVALPATDRPEPLASDGPRLDVVLSSDGKVRIGGVLVAGGQLAARLRAARAAAPRSGVRILADERLAYRRVREAMGSARTAGFRGVELATERRGAEIE